MAKPTKQLQKAGKAPTQIYDTAKSYGLRAYNALGEGVSGQLNEKPLDQRLAEARTRFEGARDRAAASGGPTPSESTSCRAAISSRHGWSRRLQQPDPGCAPRPPPGTMAGCTLPPSSCYSP